MGTTTAARAGQHLCIGLPGVKLGVADRRLLKAIQPGGIVLFARNVDTAGQLRAFTASLKSCVPFRPLLAMDVECGKVNRLRDVIGALPGIAEIKKTRKLGEARRLGHTIGRALRERGVQIVAVRDARQHVGAAVRDALDAVGVELPGRDEPQVREPEVLHRADHVRDVGQFLGLVQNDDDHGRSQCGAAGNQPLTQRRDRRQRAQTAG